MEKFKIEIFQEIIKNPQRVAILIHQRPDGDALGSGLGLARIFQKKNHKVQIFSPTPYDQSWRGIPGISEVEVCAAYEATDIEKQIKRAEQVICVDFSHRRQFGEWAYLLEQLTVPVYYIDHHPEPEKELGAPLLWDPKAPASALLVYRIVEQMGWLDWLKEDLDLARLLYIGLLTDTGLFQQNNVTPEALQMAANLVAVGVKPKEIYRLLFAQQSIRRLKFLGNCLRFRLHHHPAYQLAYFKIPLEDVQRFNLQPGDTQDLADYTLRIKGVSVGAVLMAHKDHVRLSLRSVGDVAIRPIAATYFQGGGHLQAAGGRSEVGLDETAQQLIHYVKELRKQIKGSAGYEEV